MILYLRLELYMNICFSARSKVVLFSNLVSLFYDSAFFSTNLATRPKKCIKIDLGSPYSNKLTVLSLLKLTVLF